MPKVLVVEDDAMLLSILAKHLSAAKFDVHAARDGFQGELEVKTWKPDIVLLDLLMPEEDGFAFLRKIRADDETSKTRVVVLSNLSSQQTIAETAKFGVTDYMVKSDITPHDVSDKIKAVLARG